MTTSVTLNPSNEASIKDAGSRSAADAFLEQMLLYVSRKMADAVRNRTGFNGSPQENDYFRYLCKVRYLIGRTYPKRTRKRQGR